jgi:hypothetical protein
MVDEEHIFWIQLPVQPCMTTYGQVHINYLVAIRGPIVLALQMLDEGGILLLSSIFPHQAQTSSFKVGSSYVSPHSFRADVVECGPSYRHKRQIWNKVHPVGRHVDFD